MYHIFETLIIYNVWYVNYFSTCLNFVKLHWNKYLSIHVFYEVNHDISRNKLHCKYKVMFYISSKIYWAKVNGLLIITDCITKITILINDRLRYGIDVRYRPVSGSVWRIRSKIRFIHKMCVWRVWYGSFFFVLTW